MNPRLGLLVLGCCFAGLTPLADGAQRTFVSTTGNDGNPCSLAAPCRSFGVAINAADPSGEVIVLDSGGYGIVTIAKSISLIAPPGVYAGISVSGMNDGIVVNAAATDTIILRGITIKGGGLAGIRALAMKALYIEDCALDNSGLAVLVQGGSEVHVARATMDGNFAGITVIDDASISPSVYVVDTRISGSASRAVDIGAGEATLERVRLEKTSGPGVNISLFQSSFAAVTIRDSILAGNGHAVQALPHSNTLVRVIVDRTTIVKNGGAVAVFASGSGTSAVLVSQSLISENGGAGVVISGDVGNVAVVSGSTIVRNALEGLQQAGNSELHSFGNNAVSGNNGGGAQTQGTITNDGLI